MERKVTIKVNIIRSDNDFELGIRYVPKGYIYSQGIVHQTACVVSPQ